MSGGVEGGGGVARVGTGGKDILYVQILKYTIRFKRNQYQKKINAFKSLNAAMNPPASGEDFNKLWCCTLEILFS